MNINPEREFGPSQRWMGSLVTRFIMDIDKYESGNPFEPNAGDEMTIERSNVITSKRRDGGNHLLLDVDNVNVYIKESSTPGHYHIGFPNVISDEDFTPLVDMLHKVGIINSGNYHSFKKLGHFALRLPWVKKGDTDTFVKSNLIGPETEFHTEMDALERLQSACEYLGVEVPNEIYQQLNAKLQAEDVDIPDTLPVDWK